MKRIVKWFLIYITTAVAVFVAFCPFQVTTSLSEQEAELELFKADLQLKIEKEESLSNQNEHKNLDESKVHSVSEFHRKHHNPNNFYLVVGTLICLGIPASLIVYSEEIKIRLLRLTFKLRRTKLTFALSVIGVLLALIFTGLGAILGIF